MVTSRPESDTFAFNRSIAIITDEIGKELFERVKNPEMTLRRVVFPLRSMHARA